MPRGSRLFGVEHSEGYLHGIVFFGLALGVYIGEGFEGVIECLVYGAELFAGV